MKKIVGMEDFLPEKIYFEIFPKANAVSIPFRPSYVHEIFSHLESLIGKLDYENAEFYLMGDFNCNFASSQPNNNTKLLSNLSYVYGLHQLINTPIRVKSASSILMVVSFTNY